MIYDSFYRKDSDIKLRFYPDPETNVFVPYPSTIAGLAAIVLRAELSHAMAFESGDFSAMDQYFLTDEESPSIIIPQRPTILVPDPHTWELYRTFTPEFLCIQFTEYTSVEPANLPKVGTLG